MEQRLRPTPVERSPRWKRTWFAVLLVGVLLFGSSVTWAVSFEGTPAAAVNGSNELQAAVESVEAGGGPAAAHAWTCEGRSGVSVTCGSHLPSAIGGYPSPVSWVNLTGRTEGSPGGQADGSMVWDASDGYVLLFGGGFGGFYDLSIGDYDWSYLNGVWSNITGLVTGGGPPGNVVAGLAFDPALQQVVAFGGLVGIGDFASSIADNVTWLYHDYVWTNETSLAGAAPSPRLFMAFAEDSSADEVVLFGGATALSAPRPWANDTWVFGDGKWSNITDTAGITSNRTAFPGLSNDPADSGALLVYQTNGSHPRTEVTQLFSDQHWVNLTGSLTVPAPLAVAPEMAWDAQESAVILFAYNVVQDISGATQGFSVEYAFSHGAWINLTGLAPISTVYTAAFPMFVEMPDGTVAFYGGADGSDSLVYNYFLDLAQAPDVSRVLPTSTTVDAGAPTAFQYTVGGGIAPLSYAYSFGDGGITTGFLTAAHEYAAPGPYQVTFTATDLGGETAIGQLNLTVNPALSSSAISIPSANVTANTPTVLGVTASGGTSPYAYNWSFGDGSFSHVAQPTHSWVDTGSYTIRVNVTDLGGESAVESVAIVVSNSGSSGHGGTSGISGLEDAYLIIAVLVVIATIAVVWLVARRRQTPPSHPPVPITSAPPDHPPPGAI